MFQKLQLTFFIVSLILFPLGEVQASSGTARPAAYQPLI